MSGIVEGLRDGFPTTITLAGAGTTFWEKTVQPPGIDGGEAIETTTMRNTAVRTRGPRHLYDVSPVEVSAAYDPTAYTTIIANVNVNQSIITTFPDGGTITWWGFLKSFIPESNEEGKQPVARITLIPTNRNSSGVETAPVIAAGSGTGA
jgi:hypothetical protein